MVIIFGIVQAFFSSTSKNSTLYQCGFLAPDCPSYSPDLAPSDYYSFSELESKLKKRKFNTDEEIQQAVL